MACDSPYHVTPKGATSALPVPCGRCPPCKKRRVDGWVFRLLQEQDCHKTAHFVTLTYNTAQVPVSPNGWMTLCKSDVPKYMKRLRKSLPGVTIKYYAAGEYGSTNLRPHYHIILFGVPDVKYIEDSWSIDGVPLGVTHVGDVSGDSIAYCMKYIDKSNPNGLFKGWIPYVGRDDRVREFALMSKGLGSSYVTDQVKRYHHQDYGRLFLTHRDGMKIAMPKYYRKLIYDADDGGYQLSIIQAAVAENSEKEYQKFLSYNYPPEYTFDAFLDDCRRARYQSFYSRQNLKTRSL